MARLRKAVQNTPGYGEAASGMEEDASDADRPRFGIGSLINRMSGNDTDKKAQAARKQPVAPSPPSPDSESDQGEKADPEQERIEVPAFLRRQAN